MGNNLIGWQGLVDFGPTQVTRAALSSTYISANWQRKGVGRSLLLHAMRYADQSSLHYILGWITRDNAASVNLVLSLGWSLLGALPHSGRFEHPIDYYAYAAGDYQRGARRDSPSEANIELELRNAKRHLPFQREPSQEME